MSNNKGSNRRYDYEDDGGGIDLLRRMGMPFLYILGTLSAITGMICFGLITHYWAHIENPTCFLYSQTASFSLAYKFGSSMSNCYWVTYGGIPAVMLLVVCGFLYWFGVCEKEGVPRALYFVVIGMLIALLLMLAVTCTLSEGMRITCANIGITQANNKAGGCHSKLDLRVYQLANMPVKTSTMISVTTGCLWGSTICCFILNVYHILSLNRRTMYTARS